MMFAERIVSIISEDESSKWTSWCPLIAKWENRSATPQESQRLESMLHSTMGWLRVSAIRPGKTYELKTLQNATRYLESRLNKQGYLAKVRLIGASGAFGRSAERSRQVSGPFGKRKRLAARLSRHTVNAVHVDHIIWYSRFLSPVPCF